MEKERILIVDDETAMLENCERILSREGFPCFRLEHPLQFREIVSRVQPDVVLTDLKMPGADGLTLLTVALADAPDVPVIIMTGHATVATAVQAIREGAFDYIAKPFAADELVVAVRRAVGHRRLVIENRRLREKVREEQGGPVIVGSSPALVHIVDQAKKIAPADTNVLLTGASGTGKGLLAKFIHYHSRRRERPFVAVDCAALPEGLLESELFGHEKGSFTGAIQKTNGLLLDAGGGTVFLDEIGEMAPGLQAKLLRALEDRRVRRVGGNKESNIDIRLIAATNVDIEEAVRQGRFREDLFFRINVVPLRLPTLRERAGDIAILAQRFLAQFSASANKKPPRVSHDVWDAFERHGWPGNVRELRNVTERLVVLDDDDKITLSDLPESMRGALDNTSDEDLNPLPYAEAREAAIRAFQSRYVKQLLVSSGGNVSEAARRAGVNRRTVHRWLEDGDPSEGGLFDD